MTQDLSLRGLCPKAIDNFYFFLIATKIRYAHFLAMTNLSHLVIARFCVAKSWQSILFFIVDCFGESMIRLAMTRIADSRLIRS